MKSFIIQLTMRTNKRTWNGGQIITALTWPWTGQHLW